MSCNFSLSSSVKFRWSVFILGRMVKVRHAATDESDACNLESISDMAFGTAVSMILGEGLRTPPLSLLRKIECPSVAKACDFANYAS